MDRDFQQAEAIRSAKEKQQNQDDFNNESAGIDTGRIKRFGFEHTKQAEAEQEKKRKRSLDDLLLDAAYRKAWNDAMQAVMEAQNAVYEALIKASEDLAKAEKGHADLLDRATTLPDGRKVFRDDDGTIYDENKHELSAEEQALVTDNPDAPSWKDYQRSKEHLNQANEHYDDITHKENRLQEIDSALRNGDAETLEDVEALKQESLNIRQSVEPEHAIKQEVAMERSNTAPTVVPDLDFSF